MMMEKQAKTLGASEEDALRFLRVTRGEVPAVRSTQIHSWSRVTDLTQHNDLSLLGLEQQDPVNGLDCTRASIALMRLLFCKDQSHSMEENEDTFT